MTADLKQQWRALRRERPGRRFMARYEASRRQKSRATLVSRVVRWVLALVSCAIGVVLVFIPGPAILFFALAGALLASESRVVARALDGTEVKVRKLAKWAKCGWDALPLAGKVIVAVVAAALAAGAAFIAWRLFIAR